ncbi:MAG TPA: hypothetical protein PK874_04095 [Desulfobacteraceae bacterium]|nr:hypothetical protein [Desulfobacteraceae bacterium]HPJ66992.1 hypothetical protein [Desulfobacteraceae bacterium]
MWSLFQPDPMAAAWCGHGRGTDSIANKGYSDLRGGEDVGAKRVSPSYTGKFAKCF